MSLVYIIQIMETYSHKSNELPLRCIEKVLIYVSRQVTIVFQIPPEKMFEVCFACKGFWKPRVIPKPELWNGKPLTIEQQKKPLIWVLQLLPYGYQSISDQGKSDHPKSTPNIQVPTNLDFCLSYVRCLENVPKDILYKKNKMVWKKLWWIPWDPNT